LGDVIGVRLLQAPVAAPAVDLRPVAPHESIPRAGVLGILPQQLHQREGGLRVGAARHRASYGPYWGWPDSRVTSCHLAAGRATLYISPVWCPRRGRQKPAILRRCQGDSLQKTLSVKSLSRLKSKRNRLTSGCLVPNDGWWHDCWVWALLGRRRSRRALR